MDPQKGAAFSKVFKNGDHFFEKMGTTFLKKRGPKFSKKEAPTRVPQFNRLVAKVDPKTSTNGENALTGA